MVFIRLCWALFWWGCILNSEGMRYIYPYLRLPPYKIGASNPEGCRLKSPSAKPQQNTIELQTCAYFSGCTLRGPMYVPASPGWYMLVRGFSGVYKSGRYDCSVSISVSVFLSLSASLYIHILNYSNYLLSTTTPRFVLTLILPHPARIVSTLSSLPPTMNCFNSLLSATHNELFQPPNPPTTPTHPTPSPHPPRPTPPHPQPPPYCITHSCSTSCLFCTRPLLYKLFFAKCIPFQMRDCLC